MKLLDKLLPPFKVHSLELHKKRCPIATPHSCAKWGDYILRMLGATIVDIEIGNRSGMCDIFKVEINKREMTYYFETSNILKGYKKLAY